MRFCDFKSISLLFFFVYKTVKYELWKAAAAIFWASGETWEPQIHLNDRIETNSVSNKRLMQHSYCPFAICYCNKMRGRVQCMIAKYLIIRSLPSNFNKLRNIIARFYDFISFSIIYLLFANKLIFLCSTRAAVKHHHISWKLFEEATLLNGSSNGK